MGDIRTIIDEVLGWPGEQKKNNFQQQTKQDDLNASGRPERGGNTGTYVDDMRITDLTQKPQQNIPADDQSISSAVKNQRIFRIPADNPNIIPANYNPKIAVQNTMIGNKQNVIPANGYANTRANNSQDSSSYTNQFPDIVNLMKEEIKDKNQINRLPAINTGTDNATNMPQRIAGQEVLSEPRKGADNIQRMQPISIAESTNMPADTLKQEDEKISRLKTPEEMTLEEFIKSHEGKPAPGQTKIASLDVYPDGRGNNTIGWGWNIADNGLPEDIKRYYENNKHTITQAHVNQLWKISYQKAEESCKRLFSEDVFNKLSENRKKALMDAVFNMGEEKIHGGFPKMVQNIKEGNFAQAANELKYRDGEKKDKLSGYYTQTGDRARDVIRLLTNG